MRRSIGLLGVVAVTLAGGLLVAAQAANTSRPTGKGAIRDDSVYCQTWPGGPSRPEYPGTGPQTPCGPNFQREPPPPPPEEEIDVCSVDHASIERTPATGGRARLLLAADTTPDAETDAQRAPGLWIGNQKVEEGDLATFGLDVLSPLRSEIVRRMRCSVHRIFEFENPNELKWTIELRVKIISLMRTQRSGTSLCRFMTPDDPFHVPAGWQTYPESQGTMNGILREWPEVGRTKFAVRSRTSITSAHAAVQAFRSERSALDCRMGLEVTILDAADSVLGEANFDLYHGYLIWPDIWRSEPNDPPGSHRNHALVGIGVPLYDIKPNAAKTAYTKTDNRKLTSLSDHLVIVRYHVIAGLRGETSLDGTQNDSLAGTIETADMVPGDYVYLSNVPDYRNRAEGGPWAGENAFYLGSGAGGQPLFYGFGLGSQVKTEDQLRDDLVDAYNETGPATEAQRSETQWVKLGAPVLYGNEGPAGMFATTGSSR